MDSFFWLMISFVIFLTAIGISISVYIIRKKGGKELSGKEYVYFFELGLLYVILGIVLSLVYPAESSYSEYFVFLGIILLTMGLANIDKWRKK